MSTRFCYQATCRKLLFTTRRYEMECAEKGLRLAERKRLKYAHLRVVLEFLLFAKNGLQDRVFTLKHQVNAHVYCVRQ